MTKYFIDGKPHYMIGNKSYTESEVQSMQAETAIKDETYGFADRMNGIYDKWYRYHRSDDGVAYDKGVRRATEEINCPINCEIIEGR